MLAMCVPAATAAPLPPVAPANAAVTPVTTDCYTIGQKLAEQNGGQLARAVPQVRGGRTVCIIVVLVPARDGQRPRRAEFVIPTK
jgi:hypothetical protein